MAIFLIGINHKTANTETRERHAVAENDYPKLIAELCRHENIEAAAVLSTCNRTEYYLSLKQPKLFQQTVQQTLQISTEDRHLYHKQDQQCAAHLFSVTAGIDSLVIGETQIQGQVKRSFEAALKITASPVLNQLFQMALKSAKAVRSNTEIGKNPVSVAHCAVRLSEQVFGDLSEQKILLVGAGETTELIIRYLINHGATTMSICNRSMLRARNLAKFFNADSFVLPVLPQRLAEFDLVFTATASPKPLITLNTVKHVLKRRKHRPMVMIDLSVPRNIEQRIKHLDDVFLYTIDDLQKVIENNLSRRQDTLKDARRIINAEAALFAQWQKRQKHHGLLKQLQQQVEQTKAELLKKQMPKDLNPEQQKKVTTLAHRLSKKISHQSIIGLRKIIESGNEEQILLSARLLGLNMDED